MNKTDMPANISYTLLVHAGSYKDFTKKITDRFKDLQIVYVKQKAIHYYILQIVDNSVDGYKKEDIYKLPIMAMREEFSNYLFFKSIKGYNNVLRLMCNGKNNQNAPYDLYTDMLTSIEKLKLSSVDNQTEKIKYVKNTDSVQTTITVFKNNIFNKDTLKDLFNINTFDVNNNTIDFTSILKKQNLIIGVV